MEVEQKEAALVSLQLEHQDLMVSLGWLAGHYEWAHEWPCRKLT